MEFKELLECGHIDVDRLEQKELYEKFAVLNDQMQVIYDFVLSYMGYINERHNYTAEEDLTMLEAHLLTDICDQPNITVTGLAHRWNRSVSATSQTIRRLIGKELVLRENSKEDAKIFFLIPTEKGIKVSDAHKRYDTLDTIKTFKSLKHKMTEEQIQSMLEGLKIYTELLHKGKE